MAKTLVRRSHFFEPLERLFDRTTNDWFIGLDRMIEDMSSKWDRAIDEFRELPHSHVEKVDGNHYRVVVEAAGFTREDLKVSLSGDELRIEGHHKEQVSDKESKSEKSSDFTQAFLLADGMQVDQVRMEGEQLFIDLSLAKSPEPEVKTFDIA